MRVHRSLRSRQHSSSKASVTICRDVPYGTRTRTVMDIYVPSQSPSPPKAAKAVQQATQHLSDPSRLHDSEAVHSARNSKQLPVALFCHGGVWATGVNLTLLHQLLQPYRHITRQDQQQNFHGNQFILLTTTLRLLPVKGPRIVRAQSLLSAVGESADLLAEAVLACGAHTSSTGPWGVTET